MSQDDATVPALVLGRYSIQGTLGEGGIGNVVQAFDTRLKRVIAIKTLKRSLAGIEPARLRAIEDRFAREAIAGSRMGSHPNLVAVYDLLTGPDETLYLILEYVAGGTLAERLRSGPLPLADALRLTADMARGLHAAHEVGLVHRDIKPANIFIATDGRAQVGDFGIAQIDDVSGRTQTTVGHPGTPLYMSPEQSTTTGYLRPTSDQYSLGLVVFEMLTAKAYKRLEPREVAELLAAQPRPVGALIERLTAENPADRYPSMANVLQATQAIASVMDLVPGEDTPPYAAQTPQEPPREAYRETPQVNLQPVPPVQTPQPPQNYQPPVQTPVPYPGQPHYYAPQYAPPPQYPPPRTMGRRKVLIGIGGLVAAGAAGAAGGAYLLIGRDQSGTTATATPQRVSGGGTGPQTATSAPATATATPRLPTATPTPVYTATPTPRPTSTPGPTSTPVVARFSSNAITDAMSSPGQWQQADLPGQSSRKLENGMYIVQVTKKPDGSALFSWGDWVPQEAQRGSEFMAEVEMRLRGDPEGAAGGFVFLYNYESMNEKKQYLTFQSRADGQFSIAQQLPGGEGQKILFNDWTQHPAIKIGTDIVNLLRVEVRGGKFSCYINNQPVTLNQPVPAQVATNTYLSFAANVLRQSVDQTATAIFTKFRYEKFA